MPTCKSSWCRAHMVHHQQQTLLVPTRCHLYWTPVHWTRILLMPRSSYAGRSRQFNDTRKSTVHHALYIRSCTLTTAAFHAAASSIINIYMLFSRYRLYQLTAYHCHNSVVKSQNATPACVATLRHTISQRHLNNAHDGLGGPFDSARTRHTSQSTHQRAHSQGKTVLVWSNGN